MKKKIFYIITFFLLVLSLASCNKKEESDNYYITHYTTESFNDYVTYLMKSKWEGNNRDPYFDNINFMIIAKLSNVIKILNEQSEVLKEDLNDKMYYDMGTRGGIACLDNVGLSCMWTSKYELEFQCKLNVGKPTSYDDFYEFMYEENNKLIYYFGLKDTGPDFAVSGAKPDLYLVSLSITETDEYKYEDYKNAIEGLNYNGYSGTKALRDMIFANSYELHFMPKDFYE